MCIRDRSLVDVRTTEPSSSGVTTVIADVDVHNSSDSVSVTFFTDGLSLRTQRSLDNADPEAVRNISIELDRFANSESERILRIEPGLTQHISLAFKTKRSNFKQDDWVIELSHKASAQPAYLPFSGEVTSEVSSYVMSPTELVGSGNEPVFSGRAAASPNFGSQRSLVGQTFFFVEVSTPASDEAKHFSDVDLWRLRASSEAIEPVWVTYEQRGEEVRYLAVFDIENSAEVVGLELEDLRGEQLTFKLALENSR